VLARALLDRGEPTLDCLPLYLAADAAQREKLIYLVRAAGLVDVGRADDLPPLDAPSSAWLEACALRQKRSSFALALAELLGCDPLRARKIVEDESGDALTLTFIAIGVPREIGARIFLVAFPKVALSVEVFERDMALYDRAPRRVAAQIVAAITGEAGKAGAAYLRARAARAQLASAQMAGEHKARPQIGAHSAGSTISRPEGSASRSNARR
jgi:hypothetical protein